MVVGRTVVPHRRTEEVHTDVQHRLTVGGPTAGLRRARLLPTVEASVGLQRRPMVGVELLHTAAAERRLTAVDTLDLLPLMAVDVPRPVVDSEAAVTQAGTAVAAVTRPQAVAEATAAAAEAGTVAAEGITELHSHRIIQQRRLRAALRLWAR